MRSPRISSGTGVWSRGMGLSLPLSGVPNDLEDLLDRGLDVVVRDDVVVLGRVGHLPLCDLPARRELVVRFTPPLDLPAFELLLGRRDDEDEDRVGHQPAHLLGALHVDLQDYVAAARSRALDAVAKGAVKLVVVGRVLEKGAFGDQVLELLAGEERVVLVGFLSGPRLAGRAGDRVEKVAIELEEPADQGVLSHARRPGDHDELAALHESDAQNESKSAGGAASKLISTPERGWRRRRRQAWSIGRPAPAPPPPYSASPATGWPSAARWT